MEEPSKDGPEAIPVVGSPSPQNRQLETPEDSVIHSSTPKEWADAFAEKRNDFDRTQGQEDLPGREGPESIARDGPEPVTRKGKRAIALKAHEPVQVVEEGYEGEPRLGMAFRSPEEAFRYYDRYAHHAGFGIKIFSSRYLKDGNCRYLMLSCNKDGDVKYKMDYHMTKDAFKTNCMARIGMMRRNDGLLHVTKLISEHNHPLTPGKAKSFQSRKRKQYLGDKEGIEMPIEEYVQNSKESGERICNLKLMGRDREAIQEFFVEMQTKNSYFFQSIDLDEEGRIKNVFWADGISRKAYQYFNDVVLFDTTFLIDKFDVPLVSILGVNHHGQFVLLGCGLISEDTSDTYTWLFKTWLSCMNGNPPTAIITDQSEGIQEAIIKVFPRSRHRQCLWHILKRVQNNLQELANYEEIKESLEKVLYDSLRPHEFEEEWQNVTLRFGLEENEWIRSLYEDRRIWSPVFVKDSFWAGMSITIRGECMKSFFDGHVHQKTTIQQFLNNYKIIMQSKHDEEVQADYDSLHRSPQLVTQFYMEQQLCKFYTMKMFKTFQDEIKALTYCTPSLVKVDGLVSFFEVIDHTRVKDGLALEQKSYEVLYSENGFEFSCICGYFQFKGILCRHVLSVLNYQGVVEIPSKYIVERWKKDFKQINSIKHFPNEMVADGLVEQHENFRNQCLKLAEIGMLYDGRFKCAVKVVNEAIHKLLSDEAVCNEAQAEAASPEDGMNCHMVSFSLNENRNVGGETVGPLRRQILNHPQFQFFQDRVQTDQPTSSYRSGAEWGFQQYFHDTHLPGATPDPSLETEPFFYDGKPELKWLYRSRSLMKRENGQQ
ncbi:Protein FAR1-RELATED SEQUENCE 6, partial [Ananas comosus]